MDTEQLKVLLVEDDPGDVDYLQEMLSETEGLQFELVCVDRLKAALECLREGDRQFDVMILDLGLPDSVGLETFRQIHHQALSIPIVVMTALNDSDMAMEAVREGAQDYLVKGDLTSTLLVRSIRYAVERHRMEQELRASEKRFRLFYEDAPMAYQSLDPNGCLLDVNRQWVALLGYSRDQVIGKWFGDFLTPSSQDHFKVNFLRFKAVGEVHNVHFDMIRKDGSALTAELHGRVSLDDQLRFNHAHCLFHDITERRRFEQALTASDKKYRTLFERSMDPVFIITRYGRLVEANQAFFHLFEYSEEDFEHIHISSVFVNPSDRVTVRREINERGSLKDYEIRLRTKSGAEIDCLLSATVRTSDHGTILGYQGIIRDITRQKEREETIQEQRDFLQTLLESVTHPFYVVSAENREVVMANSAARSSFSSGESTCYALTHSLKVPCNTAEHMCPITEMKKGRRPVTLEHTHYDNGGNPRTVEIHAYPVLDKNGNLKQIVEYVVDVTQRKKSEEERIRLVTAIEQSAETIMVTDTEGTILYVNPAFERVTGYSAQEAIGNTPRMLSSGRHDRAFYQQMWQTLINGQTWSGHLVNKKKDGELYEEEATISPVRDISGTIVNYVAVKRDVTGEIKLQKQLLQAQKMEAVGTLAGGIAHDFNNLLTIVLGYAELALEDKDTDSQGYAELRAIRNAARRGADLVKQILAFSRKTESELRPLNLNHSVKHAHKLLSKTIPKMIDIKLNLDKELKIANADPVQIEQIILNLAVNAKDAMPDGGKLILSTANVVLNEEYAGLNPDVVPGEHVMLTVQDTGHGMPPEIVERIFEPFFTTKKPGEGTGLGLSMLYGIVKNHGGHIKCYSEPGQGATFKIYFPVIQSEDPSDIIKAAIVPALGTETILLVDDEELIRDLGERILTKSGYNVLTAGNGKEATAVYQSQRDTISLVVLDLVMPEMGGKQCLERLLKIDPGVKVLIASGFSADTQTRETLEAGAKGFVSKPFDMNEMLGSVRRVLDDER